MSEENERSMEDAFLDVAGYLAGTLKEYVEELEENGCIVPSVQALSWLSANPEVGVPLLVYWKLEHLWRVILDTRKELSELRKHVGAPEPRDFP